MPSQKKLVDELDQGIREVVRLETRYLNENRLLEWSRLFSPDGYYWIPLEPGQTDPETHDSIIYDNRDLMEMRRHNMSSPLSPSMENEVRSVRVLSDLEITHGDSMNGDVKVTTSVIAVIHHRDQVCFAGHVTYSLGIDEGKIQIRYKRVDLINVAGPLDTIMTYI